MSVCLCFFSNPLLTVAPSAATIQDTRALYSSQHVERPTTNKTPTSFTISDATITAAPTTSQPSKRRRKGKNNKDTATGNGDSNEKTGSTNMSEKTAEELGGPSTTLKFPGVQTLDGLEQAKYRMEEEGGDTAAQIQGMTFELTFISYIY